MTEHLDPSGLTAHHVRRAQDSSSHAPASLPPELLADAARRLSWVALIYIGGTTVGHFGRRAVLMATGASAFGFQLSDMFAVAAITVGVGVYLASRNPHVSPNRVLDLGLFFQVAGAFGIAASEFSARSLPTIDTLFAYIPAECVWIVLFPLVVPNTPNKVLIASLLAATMGPAALGLSAALAGTTIASPPVVAAFYLTSNYLCAVVAYLVARMVHRVSLRLKHAREIGSYELVERIGEGGMGEVWRAKHRLLARPAAIKLVRAGLLGSSPGSRDETLRRFKREAQETATLGSIHTIDIYDFGVTEDGEFYYVMELLNGISLERFVRQFGPMEPARVVFVLQQVCHSLSEAHARGLVHRDIKPANIFLCRLGPDDDFVKVLDFGLVKHASSMAEESLLSTPGQALGTPAYMAPEIARGEGTVDGRADVYSLGCVAYFLLTGQLVFTRNSPMSTLLAHLTDQPEPLAPKSELPIPPALETLILDALAKDPAARPSAPRLGQRLSEVMPGPPWSAIAAQRWWELHPDSLIEPSDMSIAQPASGSLAAVRSERRCWPRLDRTPPVGSQGASSLGFELLPRCQF